MATTSLDKELMDLEHAFWEAMQKKDARTAGRLSGDSCVVVGPQGVAEITPPAMESMVRDAGYELKSYRIDARNTHIRKLADNVALVAYKVDEALTVEGKPVSLEAYDSSVWVRRNGS
jgi:uncharacterized protein DUF4440